jgi:hypothetical protein
MLFYSIQKITKIVPSVFITRGKVVCPGMMMKLTGGPHSVPIGCWCIAHNCTSNFEETLGLGPALSDDLKIGEGSLANF